MHNNTHALSHKQTHGGGCGLDMKVCPEGSVCSDGVSSPEGLVRWMLASAMWTSVRLQARPRQVRYVCWHHQIGSLPLARAMSKGSKPWYTWWFIQQKSVVWFFRDWWSSQHVPCKYATLQLGLGERPVLPPLMSLHDWNMRWCLMSDGSTALIAITMTTKQKTHYWGNSEMTDE